MIASRTIARDEMLAMLKTAVETYVTVEHLSAIPVIYDDTKKAKPASGHWVYAKVQHVSGSRTSLGPGGRFRQAGDLFIQVFTTKGDGLVVSDKLSAAIAAVYAGHASPSGVWFRDVVVKEIGEDGPWFQANVTVEFEYDLAIGV